MYLIVRKVNLICYKKLKYFIEKLEIREVVFQFFLFSVLDELEFFSLLSFDESDSGKQDLSEVEKLSQLISREFMVFIKEVVDENVFMIG